MDVSARLRFLRISPRKARLVTRVVQGMDALEAESQLQFMNKAAARPLLKLLRSAMANADNNNELKKQNLFVKSFFVDEGPTLKRYRPRAFGRAAEIRKRSSHVTIVLSEKQSSTKKSTTAKGAKKTVSKKPATKSGTAGKKDERPVVDYKDIKHDAKGPEHEDAADKGSDHGMKPTTGKAPGAKESFSRRLGEG